MRFRYFALCASGLALLPLATGGWSVPAGASAPATKDTVKSAQPAGISDQQCAALTGQKLANVEILSAVAQPAVASTAMPAFCRVAGKIVPEAGSDIRFEVWMPSAGWDGRFYGVGLGGYAGSIDSMTLGLAVRAGQAAVATDSGHQGSPMDSTWAKGNPQRVRDYGWRATHLSTVAGKQLVKAFYGRDADRSYFVGCSGGGRQALIEASRFPEDYDGVVAGAPAASWTDLAIAMINPIQAQLPPGSAIRPKQAALIQEEVVRQCDTVDGQIDGLVADPRQCKFDASKLACGTSKSAQCFAPAQVTALQKIYAGPRDAKGRPVAGAYLPSGAEVGTPSPQLGWEGYLLRGDSKPGGDTLVSGLLRDLVQTPFATPETFNFNTDPARLKSALSADLDASPNLKRFFARGGKLILWHGWADAAIPPEATLQYHKAMLKQSGARAKASSQLFMVPGMQHCMGGTGPGSFGQMNAPQQGDTPERSVVSALQAWVENGRKPETLVARRGIGGLMGIKASGPEKQRLLCAYPKRAVLQSGADADRASSYHCK